MTHNSGRCGSYKPGPTARAAAVGTNAARGKASVGSGGTLWERDALSEFFRAGAVGATLLIAAMTVASSAAADLSLGAGVLGGDAFARATVARGPAERRPPRAPAQRLKLPPRRGRKVLPRRANGERWRGQTSRGPRSRLASPGFTRYPTMYRAEAPPLLPPGARRFPPYAQQPYVLVAQGIWYWPGATDFKIPRFRASNR
jgi:hypothetical protein